MGQFFGFGEGYACGEAQGVERHGWQLVEEQ
jgi:hypothetical protein